MSLEDCIKKITRYQYLDFMRYPNVVAVGCGSKFIGGMDTGKLCIQVYVIKKYNKNCLGEGCIPPYYQGIQTDVIESGEIVINSKKISGSQQGVQGFSKRMRPVRMGYNIGPYDPLYPLIGTGGCIVTRADEAGKLRFYILSNNHVLSDINKLPIGTPIVQPGEGDYVKDRISRLSQFIPLQFTTPTSKPENYIDAAIAEIDSLNLVRPTIAFMAIPKGVNINHKINDFLKASGSESGYITGYIRSVSVSISIKYDGKDTYFVDQIVSTMKSIEGDSGAIALDNNNNVVGLLFAASTYTWINPIYHIQDILKVSVFTQS